jgi:hypothetical protein
LFSLVLLSFDDDLSQKDKKTDSLLSIHRLLLNLYWKLVGREDLHEKEFESQMAIYFEYLRTLSEDQKNTVLGYNKDIPSFINLREMVSTKDHRRISNELRRQLNQTNGLSELLVENEFYGLKSGVFPVDIAVKDKNSGKILLFVELDGQRFHYIKGIEEKQMLKRNAQLKAKLYEFHYPGVPLKRVLLDNTTTNKEHAKEVREMINLLVSNNPPVVRKSGFLESFRSTCQSLSQLFWTRFMKS